MRTPKSADCTLDDGRVRDALFVTGSPSHSAHRSRPKPLALLQIIRGSWSDRFLFDAETETCTLRTCNSCLVAFSSPLHVDSYALIDSRQPRQTGPRTPGSVDGTSDVWLTMPTIGACCAKLTFSLGCLGAPRRPMLPVLPLVTGSRT